MNKKETLWSQMDELITSDKITDQERKIFLDAKTKLNQNINDEAVAAQLKSQLSILAMKKLLSSSIVPFFTELSRLYLGYGRRGNVVLNPLF